MAAAGSTAPIAEFVTGLFECAEAALRIKELEVEQAHLEGQLLWAEAVAAVRARYPEDVFPSDSDSLDARFGTFARTLCDEIVRLGEAAGG